MTLTPCTQDISSCTYDDFLSLRFQVKWERERIASTWLCWWPGGGRDKIIYVMGIQILNWQELIAKEAFPSNFVTFTQETGCQISAFVPFNEPLHWEFFFLLQKIALHVTSNVGKLFSFSFLMKRKKEQFQRTKKQNRVAVWCNQGQHGNEHCSLSPVEPAKLHAWAIN